MKNEKRNYNENINQLIFLSSVTILRWHGHFIPDIKLLSDAKLNLLVKKFVWRYLGNKGEETDQGDFGCYPGKKSFYPLPPHRQKYLD